MSKYIDPYTDFGFKKIFGEEANKDLLTDFLNTLLPKRHQIETLEFRNTEQLGPSVRERKAFFDIYCENSKGEPFIVEMQKEDQEFFKDRSLYYATHPIRKQAKRGKVWNYALKTVYYIAILDFIYDKKDPTPILLREVSLKDQYGKEFHDKLQMIYLQMPVFQKKESQLRTRRDKWLYFLRNLPSLEHIPAILKEEVFHKAFHTAEVAAMSEKEQDRYEYELDQYRSYNAVIETKKKRAAEGGFQQGIEKGIEKGIKKGIEVGKAEGKVEGKVEGKAEGKAEGRSEEKIDIARNMKKKGLDPALIAEMTGLSPKEIKKIR